MGAAVNTMASMVRLGAAVLALSLSACAPEGSGSDAKASSPEDLARPALVSLNPCLDAIIAEVAAPEQVLAISHYSRDPASSSLPAQTAARFRTTGGTVEEVLALDPDVVLASSFIAPATRSAFERLGIQVETFGSPTRIEESLAQIRRIGEISGRKEQSRKLIAEIEQAVDKPEETAPVATMLWQPGQIVPGDRTLIGELLERNALVSHSAALGLGQADFVSLEAVLANPPELLLVAGDSDGQRHPLLNELDNTRVVSFDPRLLYCGARTIIDAQTRIEDIRRSLS